MGACLHEAPILVRSQRRRLCQRGMGATPIKQKNEKWEFRRNDHFHIFDGKRHCLPNCFRGPGSIACKNLFILRITKGTVPPSGERKENH